jgi:hypothetical protein
MGPSLAKGRRVLLIYGGMHLLHAPHGRTLTRLIEQETGARAYVIVPLRPLATDPGGVVPRLAACPPRHRHPDRGHLARTGQRR